jgi:hypothetical protein
MWNTKIIHYKFGRSLKLLTTLKVRLEEEEIKTFNG